MSVIYTDVKLLDLGGAGGGVKCTMQWTRKIFSRSGRGLRRTESIKCLLQTRLFLLTGKFSCRSDVSSASGDNYWTEAVNGMSQFSTDLLLHPGRTQVLTIVVDHALYI